MPKQDEDYKRQVEGANQTLLDGLRAQQKVAEKGDDIEENSWEPFRMYFGTLSPIEPVSGFVSVKVLQN